MRAATDNTYFRDDDAEYGPPGNRKPGVVEFEVRKAMEAAGNGNMTAAGLPNSIRRPVEKSFLYPASDQTQPPSAYASPKTAGADRDYPETPPAVGWKDPYPKNSNVYLCRGPADAESGMFDHWWKKTPEKEVGYGRVEGEIDGNSPCIGIPTQLTDHTGRSLRPDSHCNNIPYANKDIVNNELKIGKKTGPWDPFTNNCQTGAQDILFKSRKDNPNQNQNNKGMWNRK